MSLGSYAVNICQRNWIILNFRIPVIHLHFISSAGNRKLIALLWHKKVFTEADIFFSMNAGIDTHSDLSNGDPIELLNDLNTIIQSTWKSQTTHVIMTYGRLGLSK
jgi:hypothetical protein